MVLGNLREVLIEQRRINLEFTRPKPALDAHPDFGNFLGFARNSPH
jgi:hypothetical protein